MLYGDQAAYLVTGKTGLIAARELSCLVYAL